MKNSTEASLPDVSCVFMRKIDHSETERKTRDKGIFVTERKKSVFITFRLVRWLTLTLIALHFSMCKLTQGCMNLSVRRYLASRELLQERISSIALDYEMIK